MARYELNIGDNSESAFHNIDSTFAKPTTLTLYFSLALASGCADKYFRSQLSVSEQQSQLYIQLITLEKLV